MQFTRVGQIAVLVVVLLIYINAPVVAVRMHDFPFVIGAAVPFLLVIPLLNHVIIKRDKIRVPPVVLWILAFLVVQLIGVIVAVDVGLAVEEIVVFITEGFGIFFLLINAVRDPRMLRMLFWTLMLAGAMMGALVLFQQVTGSFDRDFLGFAQVEAVGFGTGNQTLFGEERQARLAGPIGEKNRFAQIMLVLIPIGFFLTMAEKDVRAKVVALGFTLLSAVGSVLAFSRGAPVAFVMMLIVGLALGMFKVKHLAPIIVGAIILLIAFPQYWLRLSSLGALLPSADSSSVSVDGAIEGRQTENLAAINIFSDYPIFGVGPGNYRKYAQEYGNQLGIRYLETERRAHSLYLELAANNGILGLGTFAMIMYLVMRDLLRVYRRYKETDPTISYAAAGMFLSLTAYLTSGIFLHFAYIRYFWLLMGVAVIVPMVTLYHTDSEAEILAAVEMHHSRDLDPDLSTP